MDNSLQAKNAANEHVLSMIDELDMRNSRIITYNDRFGYWGVALKGTAYSMMSLHSQMIAHKNNFSKNGLEFNTAKILWPDDFQKLNLDLALMHIPKSLEMYRNYLQNACLNLSENGIMLCGFMTRHYSKSFIEIASEYFEQVEQSLAWKKSRVLILRKPRNKEEHQNITFYTTDTGLELQQLPGVFSSGGVDIATRFLLDEFRLNGTEEKVLDLACGNGIIAKEIRKQLPESEIHLLDDSYQAIESAKINLTQGMNIFHFNDNTNELPENYFDLVLCNPPFHFEYEVDITIALNMFKEVKRILRSDGRFIIVANRHLNYITHLRKLYPTTNILKENRKFVIYEVTL